MTFNIKWQTRTFGFVDFEPDWLLIDPNDIRVINEIVKKIGLEFSVDEVAEIFSLDSLDLENKVAQIK